MIKALIVDDEESIRRVLRVNLATRGYSLAEATNGKQALELLESFRPQVMILDLGLPDMPGLEVLKEARRWTKIPILILTADNDEESKVTLLDLGADDYMAKPFSVPELLARLNVALRHHRSDQEDSPIFESGDLKINLSQKTVSRGGALVKLTATEFALISALAKRPGQVVVQDTLLREIWGPVGIENPHYLRIYVGQLRKKIENGEAAPVHLITEPGVGYKLI